MPSQSSDESRDRKRRWLAIAGQEAASVADDDDRARLLIRILRLKCELREVASAAGEIAAIETILSAPASKPPATRAGILVDIASALVWGDQSQARQYFDRARGEITNVQPQFLKQIHEMKLFFVAAALGEIQIAGELDKSSGGNSWRLSVASARKHLMRKEMSEFEQELGAMIDVIEATSRATNADQFQIRKLRDDVLGLLIESRQLDRCEKWAQEMTADSLSALDLARLQWEAGRVEAYRRTINRQLNFALQREDPCGNYHHTMSKVERIALVQHKLEDHAGYAATMERAEAFAGSMQSPAPWIAAGVYSSLAYLQHLGGDISSSRESLRIAYDAAEAQAAHPGKDRSIITTVWLSVSDGESDLDECDRAVGAANRIENEESRLRQIVKVLAKAGRDDALLGVLEGAKSAEDRADLAIWAAQHVE